MHTPPRFPKRLAIPQTKRLERLAAAWAASPKPQHIPAPGPGQESVWDYPRPPAVERVDEQVEVFVGDRRIAHSNRCLRVLETASPPTIYFPPQDVEQSLLRPEQRTSYCEWKGAARYYGIDTGAEGIASAAWSYPNPLEEYAALANYISFYPGRVTRCLYGGKEVEAQPGDFYGGWIDGSLVGPFKGFPGSEGW